MQKKILGTDHREAEKEFGKSSAGRSNGTVKSVAKKALPLLAVLWFLLVTVLLSLPGSAFPKENWLDKIWFDKWVHIFLFGMLAFLSYSFLKQFSGKKIRLILWVIIACFLYGIAMEFVQKYFIPDRSFDIGDIAADGIGSAVGGFFAARRYIKK